MTAEERLAWEKQQGFTSFATKSNEVYEKVAETFNSIENLKSLVQSNSKFIELSIQNNDYTLENKLRNNSNRFLINDDKILKIGTDLYKFLDEYTISTSLNNLNELQLIDDSNISNYFTNSNFQFTQSHSNLLKDYSENYGTYKKKHAFDNNDKQRVRLEVSLDQIWDYVTMNVFTIFNADFTNHNKKLGVWIKCRRTIIADIKARIDYMDPLSFTWKHYTLAGRVSAEEYQYNIKHYCQFKISNNNQVNVMLSNPAHFGALKCDFRNKSTNYSKIYYNESFLNYNYNTNTYPWYNTLFLNII